MQYYHLKTFFEIIFFKVSRPTTIFIAASGLIFTLFSFYDRFFKNLICIFEKRNWTHVGFCEFIILKKRFFLKMQCFFQIKKLTYLSTYLPTYPIFSDCNPKQSFGGCVFRYRLLEDFLVFFHHKNLSLMKMCRMNPNGTSSIYFPALYLSRTLLRRM